MVWFGLFWLKGFRFESIVVVVVVGWVQVRLERIVPVGWARMWVVSLW